MLAIAGLWSVWQAPDRADMLSCTLLIREAEERTASIHHSMAVLDNSMDADTSRPSGGPSM